MTTGTFVLPAGVVEDMYAPAVHGAHDAGERDGEVVSRGGAAERGEDERLPRSLVDDITAAIVDAAYKLHIGLGPGLLEFVYEAVLARDLMRRGLRVERQKPISFEYDGLRFEDGYRVDLMAEARVIVEIKSIDKVVQVHSKQLLTYLRLLNLPVGLLINFGAPTLKEGLQRIVNGLPNSASPRLRVNQAARDVSKL